MNVLFLDNARPFLNGLPNALAGSGCQLHPVRSAKGLLQRLRRPPPASSWDMVLVNQVFLHNNGSRSRPGSGELVTALREEFEHVPVAILSEDDISTADYTYKGLRKQPWGRKGYTTFIFKSSEQDRDVPTCPEDVCQILAVRQAVSGLLADRGWLADLARASDVPVGLSVVDDTYRLQYVSSYLRRISCRQDIQLGGICWMEFNPDFCQEHHCPWCPVARVRGGAPFWESTTISPVPAPAPNTSSARTPSACGCAAPLRYRFFNVRAYPITRGEGPAPKHARRATLEVVADCTEEMLDKCRAAILKGKEPFRKEMCAVLRRMCHLGFERARFWIQNLDSRYLDGFASHGRHDRNVEEVRLDGETDPYAREARERHHHFYSDAKGLAAAKEIAGLRAPATPWIEVPLWAETPEGPVFVGKISLDNQGSERNLRDNEPFWPLLDTYAKMLGPIIWEAREYWRREERARQAQLLRDLDFRLVDAKDDVSAQMQAILECAERLLRPDHCHLRLCQGSVLALVASHPESSRIRHLIDIEEDLTTSISAQYASGTQKHEHRIWHEPELRLLADQVRQRGRFDAANYFDRLKSCGAFGLQGDHGEFIGVLVLDSKQEHFFDDERISLVKDLVHRAQVLVAHNIGRARLLNLVNSLESEVAVFDPKGNVILGNQAWHRRVDALPQNRFQTEPPPLVFPQMARCGLTGSPLFQKEIEAVFTHGEPAHFVSAVESADGRLRQMAVMAAPFEKNDNGQVVTVVLVMSDITEMVSIEGILAGAKPNKDLPQALADPLKSIQKLFKADRASVAECLCVSTLDSPIRIRCRINETGEIEQDPQVYPAIPKVGSLVNVLQTFGFVAVPDAASSDNPLSEEMRGLLRQQAMRSLLAAPIYLSGEDLWGMLVIAFKERRTFSGREVHLLRAAAAQLSALVLLSRQAELRSLDKQIAYEISSSVEAASAGEFTYNLLRRILREAIRLTGCTGGHVRVVDWFDDQLELRVPEGDPLAQEGKDMVRKCVRVGQPVAGIVAQSGNPVIVNHRKEFDPRDLDGIPPERQDVRAALEAEQSFLCLPLISAEEIFGTATLTSQVPEFFQSTRLQLLEDFIQRAALVLHASRQMERMRELTCRLDELLKSESLEKLWAQIPEVAVRLFQCELASVSSYNTATHEITRKGMFTRASEYLGERVGETTTASDKLGCGLSRYVAQVGKTLRLSGEAARTDPHLSPAGAQYHAKLPSGRFKSILVARLDTPDGMPVGLLRLINRKGRIGDLGFTEFDETLMKLLGTKLAIAIERLRLIEERNTAIITTAHDLKTPLQNIRWTLDSFVKGKFHLPSDAPKLHISADCCTLLDAFIFSTIDVAQGRIDPDRVYPSQFDAETLAWEAINVLKLKFDQDGWARSVQVDPQARQLYGDRQQILRVLLNLCHNAWKYGSADEAQRAVALQENRLELVVSRQGHTCVIQVADRGPGRRRATLTEPKPRAPIERGHGVGLASAHLVAKAHFGDIVIGDRHDGKSGFQVKMIWNEKQLQDRYPLEASSNQ